MSTGIDIRRKINVQNTFSSGSFFSNFVIWFRGISFFIKFIPYILESRNAIIEPIVHADTERKVVSIQPKTFDAIGMMNGKTVIGGKTIAVIVSNTKINFPRTLFCNNFSKKGRFVWTA